MNTRFLQTNAFKAGDTWGFWFRVFGYGFVVSNLTPMFSERNGHRKAWRVGGIKIEFLSPGA